MNSQKTKKILIASIVVLVICGGAYTFFYLSSQSTYSKASELAIEIGDISLANSKSKLIENFMDEASLKREAIDGRFVSPDGVVDFIEYVESVAKNSGVVVDVKSVSTAPLDETNRNDKGEDEGLERLSMIISFTGGWKQSFSFLVKLENLPYRTDVNGVLLERVDTGSKKVEWSGEYALSVLKLK